MNISPKTISALQQQGWDIIRVSQILPATASDQEILHLARQADRVIVTQDLDFSTLLALGGYNRPSLITLRLSTSDPDTVTQQLLRVLATREQALQDGCDCGRCHRADSQTANSITRAPPYLRSQ
jgi:predicted nuclease of predicted toxin-antitoxin system